MRSVLYNGRLHRFGALDVENGERPYALGVELVGEVIHRISPCRPSLPDRGWRQLAVTSSAICAIGEMCDEKPSLAVSKMTVLRLDQRRHGIEHLFESLLREHAVGDGTHAHRA